MTTNKAGLEAQAEAFAAELSETLVGVLGAGCPALIAEASPVPGPVQRISVHTEDSAEIPLYVDGRHSLSLVVSFECVWDHVVKYLAVKEASFKVTPARAGNPLFRYEFVKDQTGNLPSAHLHVHAHRDEFLFALFRGGHGRPQARAAAVLGRAKRSEPQLSDVHFPLGGPRMRPCVEDILQMLYEEFAIDVQEGFQQVIDNGRARWRRTQIAAAVRDAPAEAMRVLTELGYSVTEPAEGPRAERWQNLIQN